MEQFLLENITDRLITEFEFKKQDGWLTRGKCPNCNKKELYAHADGPWVVRCNRLNNCGYEEHIKVIYPDLFESWSERYPISNTSSSQITNTTPAADAYLAQARGFDLSRIKGWYTQESYFDYQRNIGSATVRFPFLDAYWERLIDKPDRFGSQKARFAPKSKYRGHWWLPPSTDMANVKQLWIVEGIFNSIALLHHDITAAAIMSCNNFPDKELDQLTQNGHRPELVLALDNDKAGTSAMIRFKERLIKDGWLVSVAVINKQGADWNDLHCYDLKRREDEPEYLSDEAIDSYLYAGRILTAKSAAEKGMLLYNQNKARKAFDFQHKQNWYWFEYDLEKYQKAYDTIVNESDNPEELSREEIEEMACMQSNQLQLIAQCYAEPLYFQKKKITDESWYYFRVTFPHGGDEVKDTFTSAQLSNANEFGRRLMAIAPGAVFNGNSKILRQILTRRLFNIKEVQTIDFIGYSTEFNAYLFNDVAVKDGRIYQLNPEDYFDMKGLSIKSLNKSVQLNINNDSKEYKKEWLEDLWGTYGPKGIVALTFWMGSLFAEQIRKESGSFPFLEIVGDAGTGKTVLIEFLWRLLGRDWEGFDPSKSRIAARTRQFAQVSNLPVVLIESDRESPGGAVQSFDWDELKTAYNGGVIRSRGVATSGNETYDPPFRGSIVISQNNPVNASEAIMQRICHLYFTKEDISTTSAKHIKKLQKYDEKDISYFILEATKRQDELLKIVNERTSQYAEELATHPEIKTPRIALNHGQLLSLLDALCELVSISEEQKKEVSTYIKDMAVVRQQAIQADHPIVAEFWEIYEYLNGSEHDPRLNHSAHSGEIAINLNEFVQLASEHKQQVPNLRELKNHLKNSCSRKYTGQRSIHSAIRSKHNHLYTSPTVRVWTFTK